ncbi:MAG: arginine repressor [Actinobacteria bacterium]|nr:arginine repressor [Actinomycetota bacterium]
MHPRQVEKLDRQRLLRGLILDHDIASQEHARELLEEHGIETTQATISRDLDDLGAVKVRGPDGQLVYRLSNDPAPATARDQLADTCRRFLLATDASANLAVLRTQPAGAGPVASAIDHAELPGVLGTVAGDDTVLVIAAEGTPGRDLADRFARLADL